PSTMFGTPPVSDQYGIGRFSAMAKLESEVESSGPTLRQKPELRWFGDQQYAMGVPASSLRREHPLLGWQRMLGNRAVQRMFFGSRALQPQLTVRAPDYIHEKEADDVAQEVSSPSVLARVSS